MKYLIALLILILSPTLVFAGFDEVMSDATGVIDSVMGHSGSITLALEFILRLIPSEKPMSLLLVASKVLHKSALFAEKFATSLDELFQLKKKS